MKYFSWVITLFFIALGLLGIFYLKHSISAESAQESYEPAATIQAMSIQKQLIQPSHQVLGETVATEQVMLKNELGGKIVYLNLDPSVPVTKDQVLLRIDDSQEQAQLRSAQASANLKRQTLERIESLFNDKRISREKLDVATAELAIAQARVGEIQSIIDKKTVKAPFDAEVGIHNLALGQTLTADADIVELIGISDSIWVDFNVPQVYPMLDIGSAVELSLPHQQASTTAQIVSVAPSLRGQSRQMQYRAKLSLDSLTVKPQFLLNVNLPIAQSKQAIVVPNLAIVRDQLGDYVYVIANANGDLRVSRRQVLLGERLPEGVVIESGVELGERIATIGAFKLWESAKVVIETPAIDDIVEMSEQGGIR